jgi:carbamoyltransferase
MNILGISCYYHDSAACLVKDGKIVAAAQEERFNRLKNSSVFPLNAINYCVQAGEISFSEIDYVAFYEKPYLKFSRVIFDHIKSFPFSYGNFLRNIPQWLQDRLILPLVLKKEIGFEGETVFIKHHLAHASSSFLVSPFDEAAIIVADGVGEFATTSYGFGKGNDINILKEIHYPDSLGLLYSAITTYLGFKANSGEGTTMALASFGKPEYIDQFYKIIDVKDDGSFHLNSKYFGYTKGKTMYSRKLVKLLGPPRKKGTDYLDRHKNIAASLQLFIEETLIKIANNLYLETKMPNLCLAGGVFLNCVANQKILEQTPFEKVFIQPGAGDAGASIGAAMNLYNCILGNQRSYVMEHAYLGPEFSKEEIKRIVLARNIKYTEFNEEELTQKTAKLINDNKTVGWLQGRLEFGPRALGNRTILANATNAEMVNVLNDRIKHREWFRPFAPIVPEDRANEFFEMNGMSPFMLLAPKVREHARSLLPAITHIDCTARVQTVSKKHNPRLYKLLIEVEKLCGVPIAINTSFNLQGEPIVCTPDEAINDFLKCEMDYLIIGNFLLEK